MSEVKYFKSVNDIPDSYMNEVWNKRWPDIKPSSIASNQGRGDILVNTESLDKLQTLQSKLGPDKPLIIISGFRNIPYNRSVGSKDTSQHVQGRAFDIMMYNQDPEEFQISARDSGFTGMGYYGKGNGGPFMHLDDRSSATPDNPATWHGTAEDWPYKTIKQLGRSPNPDDNPPTRSSRTNPSGQSTSGSGSRIPHVGRVGTGKSGPDDPGVGVVKFDPKSFDVNSELSDNPLDKYIDVTPNVRLSMVQVPRSGEMSVGDYSEYVTLPYVTFASSASQSLSTTTEIVRLDELGPSAGSVDEINAQLNSIKEKQSTKVGVKQLYTVQKFSSKHVTTVTSNNPELAFTTEVKISVHEPYGVSFEKELRKVAQSLGYRVAPVRIIWRLDIHWSGWNPDTGEWVQKIPFSNQFQGEQSRTITQFLHLITLEGNVDSSGGSNWDLHMTPVGFASVWKEVITFDAAEIKSESATLGGYLDLLQTQLNTHKAGTITDSPEGHFRAPTKYKYEINYSQLGELANTSLSNVSDVLKDRGLVSNDEEGGDIISIGKDTTAIELIRAFLDSSLEVNKEFTQEGDPNKVNARTLYVIRPSVVYDDTARNGDTNDYKSVKVIYHIEKFEDWRININDPNLNTEGLRQQRIANMINTAALRRVYNYSFTPTSSEVKNLDIKLKLVYYDQIVDPSPSNERVGSSTPPLDASSKGQEELAGQQANKVTFNIEKFNKEEKNFTNFNTNEVSSSDNQTDSHIGGSEVSHSRIYKGVSTFKFKGNAPTPAKDPIHYQYEIDLEQRLFNDLVKLSNMEVRGDPRWLLSKSTANVPATNSNFSSIIRLNINSPDQDEYMQEVWDPRKPPTDESLGGFYEIITVETIIENGMFNQKLDGYRIRSM